MISIMSASNPLLEVNPAACLFVVGPQLTARHLENDAGALGYRSIVETGIAALQSSKAYSSKEEKVRDVRAVKEEARKNLVLAMQKIMQLLKQQGCYEAWLYSTFGHKEAVESMAERKFSTPSSVAHLLSLQSKGALLACTQYDTLLDSMADTKPYMLQEVREWAEQGELRSKQSNGSSVGKYPGHTEDRFSTTGGFLHLNGVYTQPESVHLVDTESDPVVCNHLREIFQKKIVIFLGFDGEYMDPLLPAFFSNLFLENDSCSLRNPPILLTSRPPQSGARRSSTSMPSSRHHGFSVPAKFLQLRIQEEEIHCLSEVISVGSTKNFTVGRGQTDKQSDEMKVQAFLLFNEKQSFRKLGDVIYQQSKSGEIYVRRDALTVIFDNNQILYGNLVTYGGNGLRQLWDLVFSEESTLLGKGLVGFGLQNAAIIWTRRKPAGLGNVTGINSVHTYAAHKALHTLTLAQQCSVSDSKSPILVPVSTPPSTSDYIHPITTPKTNPTPNLNQLPPPSLPSKTSPAKLPAKLPPNTVSGGQSRTITSPIISPPSGNLPTPPPLIGIYPTLRGAISMSRPMPTLPVNPVHNPFMTGLTRMATPRLFPPMLIGAKNPLLSTSATVQPSSSHTHVSTPTRIQPQAVSVNSGGNLSTHMQMVLKLQSAQLNALSAASRPSSLSPPNPFVSPTVDSAGYILQPRSVVKPPTYNIAPPAELMSTCSPHNVDPALYEHTIEYIDTLSQSTSLACENGRTKKKKRSVDIVNNDGRESSRVTSSGHSESLSSRHLTSQPLISRPPERLTQPRVHGREPTRVVVTDQRETGLLPHHSHPSSSSSGPQRPRQENHRRRSQDSFRQHAVTSQREHNLPTLPQSQAKDKPHTLRLDNPRPIPSSTLSKTKSTKSTPTLVPTPLQATPTPVLHTINPNPAAAATQLTPTAVMAPSLVSLPTHGVGYCFMVSPFPAALPTQAAATLQPTVLLPAAAKPTEGAITPAAILPQQLPLLLPAAQPAANTVPPAATVVAAPTAAAGQNGGMNQQLMYYLVAESNKTTPITNGSNIPLPQSTINRQTRTQTEQQLHRRSSAERPAGNRPTSANVSTGSVTRKHPTLHKRAIPEDALPPLPVSKYKKTSNHMLEQQPLPVQDVTVVESERLPFLNRTTLNSNSTSRSRSHDVEHRSHDIHYRSHDVQYRSHDARRWSHSSTESNQSIEVATAHKTTPHPAAVIAASQYVSDEENLDSDSEEMDVEREEREMIPGQNRTQHLTNSSNPYKSPIQLWEFLLQLLLTPDHGTIIQWTGDSYEFSIINPDAVARLWGSCKNKPCMTYEKLGRALRYYYSRGILDKVSNKRLTFRFSFDVHKYLVERNKTSRYRLESCIT